MNVRKEKGEAVWLKGLVGEDTSYSEAGAVPRGRGLESGLREGQT